MPQTGSLPFRFDVKKYDRYGESVSVLKCTGMLVGGGPSSLLENEIQAMAEKKEVLVVLDLTAVVDGPDSTATLAILNATAKLRKLQGMLCCVGLDAGVLRKTPLLRPRLNEWFSLEEALKKIRERRR